MNMANILDYLEWRGDLPFETSAFNEVDAVVFSRFSYIPFEGIVPDDFNHTVTVAEAACCNGGKPTIWQSALMRLCESVG